MAGDETVLVSPCDGKVTVSRIGSDSRFYIKDTPYTLGRLLKSESLARRYLGGYAMILRLTVDDYHHYCYVVSGKKSGLLPKFPVFFILSILRETTCIPSIMKIPGEYSLIKTEKFGTLLMMEVGAMMVGKITNLDQGP